MTDYEKLKKIIDDIDDLISRKVTSSVPEFEAWQTKTERFLIKRFGENSLEHKKFINIYFAPLVWCGDDEEQDLKDSIKWCSDGLSSCKAVFKTYLEDIADGEKVSIRTNQKIKSTDINKIFIVHGHDSGLKHEVARLVENQGLTAVILSEQANLGKTIIEKIEEYSNVNGAICLFTADDLGRVKSNTNEQKRARQNVVLETGYFMAKLGRNRTVILADEGIEMPSDLSGVVYTNTSNWQVALLKDLKAMGYNIDFNKLF